MFPGWWPDTHRGRRLLSIFVRIAGTSASYALGHRTSGPVYLFPPFVRCRRGDCSFSLQSDEITALCAKHQEFAVMFMNFRNNQTRLSHRWLLFCRDSIQGSSFGAAIFSPWLLIVGGFPFEELSGDVIRSKPCLSGSQPTLPQHGVRSYPIVPTSKQPAVI